MDAFHSLVALLRFQRQGGDGPRFQATQTDRLAGFFAIAILAVLDSQQCLVDLADQFSRAITGSKFQRPVGLHAGAIGDVGFKNTALAQACQGIVGVAQLVGTPAQQFLAEILHLQRVHERLAVRGGVVGGQREHHLQADPRR